jgi:hypothetical protein
MNIVSLFPRAGSNIHVWVVVKLVFLTRRMPFRNVYVLDPKADKNNAKYEGNIIHVLNKTKHDAMKTYGGVGYLYIFLTSVLHGYG